MVSLARSDNLNSGGATFFSESTNMDRDYLLPILQSQGIFRPLNTISSFSFLTLATLGLEVTAIVFAAFQPDEAYKCREYFILIYAHIGLWFLTVLVHLIVSSKHQTLRLNGYFEIYRKLQVHHKLPLYIVSLWNTVILLLQGLMQYYYPDNFAEKCLSQKIFGPRMYFCALMTLETCFLLGVNLNYMLTVARFNKIKPVPDVQREEWNTRSGDQGFATGEVGYQHIGDKIDDLLEKQSDVIGHLKDHNKRLGVKIMTLSLQNTVLKDELARYRQSSSSE